MSFTVRRANEARFVRISLTRRRWRSRPADKNPRRRALSEHSDASARGTGPTRVESIDVRGDVLGRARRRRRRRRGGPRRAPLRSVLAAAPVGGGSRAQARVQAVRRDLEGEPRRRRRVSRQGGGARGVRAVRGRGGVPRAERRRGTQGFARVRARLRAVPHRLEEALAMVAPPRPPAAPREHRVAQLEAQLLYRLGRPAEAADAYERVLGSSPDGGEAAITTTANLVAALVASRRHADVAEALRRRDASPKASFEIAFNVACGLIAQREFEDARAYLALAKAQGEAALRDEGLAPRRSPRRCSRRSARRRTAPSRRSARDGRARLPRRVRVPGHRRRRRHERRRHETRPLGIGIGIPLCATTRRWRWRRPTWRRFGARGARGAREPFAAPRSSATRTAFCARTSLRSACARRRAMRWCTTARWRSCTATVSRRPERRSPPPSSLGAAKSPPPPRCRGGGDARARAGRRARRASSRRAGRARGRRRPRRARRTTDARAAPRQFR